MRACARARMRSVSQQRRKGDKRGDMQWPRAGEARWETVCEAEMGEGGSGQGMGGACGRQRGKKGRRERRRARETVSERERERERGHQGGQSRGHHPFRPFASRPSCCPSLTSSAPCRVSRCSGHSEADQCQPCVLPHSRRAHGDDGAALRCRGSCTRASPARLYTHWSETQAATSCPLSLPPCRGWGTFGHTIEHKFSGGNAA